MPTEKPRKQTQSQQIITLAEAIHADLLHVGNEIEALRADLQRNALELDELRWSLSVLAHAVLAQKEEDLEESREASQERQRVLFSIQHARRAEPLCLRKEDRR